MTKIKIIDATLENVKDMKGNIRELDHSLYNEVPVDNALDICVENSSFKKVVLLNDKPVAVFGVRSAGILNPNTGYPWMITIKEVNTFSKTIVRYSKLYVKIMLKHYKILTNAVSVDNELCIRWLEWCGFVFDKKNPVTVNGHLFYFFKMEGR